MTGLALTAIGAFVITMATGRRYEDAASDVGLARTRARTTVGAEQIYRDGELAIARGRHAAWRFVFWAAITMTTVLFVWLGLEAAR